MQSLPSPCPSRTRPRRRSGAPSRGFTAIELMVTVAILALLAALAAPSFTSIIERWRVQQAVESMTSTLYYARSEAVKRGGRIGIQKIAQDTDGCKLASTNEEWGCGWFVFVDSDDDGKWKSGEEILQTLATPANTNVVHKSGGTNIKVDRYGMTSGLNAKGFIFSPEPAGISSSATRGICMGAGGRIRVIKEVPCQ
ncbi:GspH/FimT family pseudopilin [Alicycliphilus denitrificans]|uniref:Type II secretion system protein H n=1 Tax=Alicycliphilus denitrificans TaxID=179636 RepID=A0A420KAY7_9BURK|nr:GspH/FimT family pseudopilin [Alicycliphilus denitrificans]RKJ96377.1 prepilin-type N-terminal cleavage/methylation domain-containing protein [Alicycliphilus denitrificans]